MAWIKLDDQWMDNPKIVEVGRDGRDMWLASITYCAKHLTDGYFHKNLLPILAVMAGVDVAKCQQIAKSLLNVCLWELDGEMYCVHDYLDFNPSKEQTEANRNARAEAGRAGGIAKASKMSSKSLAKNKQKPAPSPSPSPSLNPKESDPLSQFDIIQQHIENTTGLMPDGGNAVKAINQIIEMGATTDDITNGFNWLKEQGKVVRFYSSLVGPTKTAMLKHIQDKSRPLTEEEKYPSAREEQITETDIQSWLDLEMITEEKAQELREKIGVAV